MRSFAALPLALLVTFAAAPLAAQMDHDDPTLAGVRAVYSSVKGYLLETARQAPQELYDYRPTEEVRSFGEILGHIADAGYLFCGSAADMETPSMDRRAEELSSKAEIMSALEASFEFCDRAHEMDTETANEPVRFFNQDHTRLSVLAFNMGHDYEHYGNLVTYMRINGMVPPSSQGGM